MKLNISQTITILIGSVSLIMSLGVFLFWIQSAMVLKSFRENGVELSATVLNKKEIQNAGNRAGGFTSYALELSYSYYLKDGKVCGDCGPTSKIGFSIVPGGSKTSGSTGGVLNVSTYQLSRYVFYSDWESLKKGDKVAIVVLPDNPQEQVLLKSNVDGSSKKPFYMNPMIGFVFLLVGIGGVLGFIKLGGKFSNG